MPTYYLRRDLPDGHADTLSRLAEALVDGSIHAQADATSRHPDDLRSGCVDAARVMRRAADQIARLAREERVPG